MDNIIAALRNRVEQELSKRGKEYLDNLIKVISAEAYFQAQLDMAELKTLNNPTL